MLFLLLIWLFLFWHDIHFLLLFHLLSINLFHLFFHDPVSFLLAQVININLLLLLASSLHHDFFLSSLIFLLELLQTTHLLLLLSLHFHPLLLSLLSLISFTVASIAVSAFILILPLYLAPPLREHDCVHIRFNIPCRSFRLP